MAKKISEQPTILEGAVFDGSEIVVYNKNGLTYRGTLFELLAWKVSLAGGIFIGPLTYMAGTASIAPLNFQLGTLLTTPVANAFEYNGTNLFITNSAGARKQLRHIDDIVAIANGGTGSASAAAALTALGALPKANPTSTGKMTTAASVAGNAGFRIPHGVDPTTLADGDVWTKSTGLFARIGGVTKKYREVAFAGVTALADAPATLTAAQLLGSVFTINPTESRALTTDLASAIIAALPDYVVGSCFDFTVVNSAAFEVMLVGGTGVSIVGKASVTDASATWKAVVSSATTVVLYRL